MPYPTRNLALEPSGLELGQAHMQRGDRVPTFSWMAARDLGFFSYFRCVLKYSSAILYSSKALS